MTAGALQAITGFALVTPDLARLVAFYRDVLGLALHGDAMPIDQEEMALLGLSGTGRRQVLGLGDQTVWIDQFADAGRPHPADGDAASLWFQHLALVVDDMGAAYSRLGAATPISQGGPQRLPAFSGGVEAYKFRDPDGHPLELLRFPDPPPAAWRDRRRHGAEIGLGIDHSAISVADPAASDAFYRVLGLQPGDRTLNRGPSQQRLDGLPDVEGDVVPLQPPGGTPHLELLGYRAPKGQSGPRLRTNDVAATRIIWRGEAARLLGDPDGHLHQTQP